MIRAYDEHHALIASAETDAELWRMPGVLRRAVHVCDAGEEPAEIREAQREAELREVPEEEMPALLVAAARGGRTEVWTAAVTRYATSPLRVVMSVPLGEMTAPEQPGRLARWGAVARSWGFSHPIAFAAVAFVTLGAAFAFGWLLLFGDGALPPFWRGSNIDRQTLCPSIDEHDEQHIRDAEEDWIDAGWPELPIARGPCIGPPEPGEAQWRAETDVVSGWAPLALHHGSVASVGVPVERAVVYLQPRFGRKPCVVPHELGHVHGLEDANAATSIMAHDCGSSWALVQRDLYPEVPHAVE